MVKVKGKNNIDIMTILAFLIVARLACPALSNIPLMNMTFIFIYGMAFCVFFIFMDNNLTRVEKSIFWCVLIYVLYTVFRILISNGGIFDRDAFNAYTLFFLINIFLWVKKQSNDVRSNLLKLILIACLFNFVYSIVILILDPDASRKAAATSVLEGSRFDILNAVGSFDAVYGGIFIVLLMIYMRKKMAKGGKKTLLTVIMISALIFIIMSAYATAILLLIVTLFIYFSNKSQTFSIIGIVIAVGILLFHEAIGGAIMTFAKKVNYSQIISTRIEEFGYMLKTFEAAGTYAGEEGRWQKMLNSINAFLAHPLFGALGDKSVKVGGHSEFFDILGKYGIVGFGMLVSVFVNLYKVVRSDIYDRQNVKCLNIIYFIYVLLSILNPSLYALLIMPIILIVPLSESYTMGKEQNQQSQKQIEGEKA